MIRFLQTPSLARKIIFGVIIFLACVAMVITLIPGGFLGDAFGFGTPGAGVLAKVGDQDVTISEAQMTARNMMRRQFPRGGSSQLMPLFLQSAVNNLIYEKAMVLEAEHMGLSVSDQEVADWLQHGPYAQILFPGGQFVGQDHYEQFTEQNLNLTVPGFEAEVKNDLLLDKLRNLVTASATVSDAELHQAYLRRNTKVKFDYAVLTQEDLLKQIKPTDAELKAFFEKNKAQYQNAIPEKRRISYVVIDTSDLKSKVQVTPEELRNYYNAHIDEYRVPEEVKLRQILISAPAPGTDGKPDPKALDAARAKAEDILKQLKSGAKFADLAKKYSQDTDSAPKGGEVGWVQLQQIPLPEVRSAIAALPAGQTSNVVQSALGFQIFQVEEKHTAHVKSLEEVKAQIEPVLAAQKAANEAESLSNTLESQARTTGLANAAKKNGLQLYSTGLVARTDSLPAVGQAPEFMSAAFSVQANNPPEMVRLAQGSAIFQVTEIKPPQTPAFEQIRDRVESDFKQQQASQLLAQKIQQLADRARAEHNLKKAAAEVGATVKTSDLVGPQAQVPDIGALSGPAAVVFDMKPGQISDPIQTGRGGAVLALTDRQEPSPAAFDQQKEQLRETLLSDKRRDIFNQFLDSLRNRLEKEGKIRVNKQEMDRLLPKPEAS